MKTNYTIKNFRVFDRKGVTVELSPLTFLVGCNSSGKSSIVKSLSLLKSFFQEQAKGNKSVIGTAIDFSTKPNNTLGSFRNVICSSSRGKTIELAYTTHSSYLNEDVEVSLILGDGELGNAVVTGVRIKLIDGDTIAAYDKQYSGNFESLKINFARYLAAVRLRSKIEAILPEDPDEYESFIAKEENKKKIDSLVQEANIVCDNKYLQEVYTNRAIKQCRLSDTAKLSIDKFLESGILTYFSIFDEMENMTDTDEIFEFLKSKIKDDEVKIAMNKAIDLIRDDYEKRAKKGFLNYYRSLEDEELKQSGLFHFDKVLKPDNNEWPSLRKSLFSNSVDSVYGLLWDMENKGISLWKNDDSVEKEIKRVNLVFVIDTLAHLYDNGLYYDVYHRMRDYAPTRRRIHPLYYDSLEDYVNFVFEEVTSKDITYNLDYISSSRIQVRRMYPMEDKTEFTDAVKTYFETRSKFMTLTPPITVNIWNKDQYRTEKIVVSDFVPGSFMNKWLRLFRIGDHISLDMDKNGLGLLLRVYRSENDKKGVLLADMGYGITQLFSILLQIEEMIMSILYQEFKGKTEGSGLIYEKTSITTLKPQTVAIEEPEIHLHPKFQSLLAEMFYEAYKDYSIHFIVETHSEYLLRKIQTLVGAKKLIPEEISMIYVEDNDEVSKGAQKVRRIPIKDDGRLAAPFSPGFYDEADNLSLELFTNMGK